MEALSCNQELLQASITANQSYGGMLGTDSYTANQMMTQYNDYQSAWANDGATMGSTAGTTEDTDSDGYYFAETTDNGTTWQINHHYLTFTDDGSAGGKAEQDPGRPLPGVNYSNAQIQMQMDYIATWASGKTGDELTKAQLYLNQWQTTQSAMSATQGINGAMLKNNTDTYTSQLQLDQSNQQSANSALSGTLGDLMSSTGGTLGQGVM